MAKHWAIAIGINTYEQFQSLSFAQQDAEAFHHWLVEEADVPSDQCVLLTPMAGEFHGRLTYPNQEAIAQWLNWLCGAAIQPGDRLWIFFSGYGVCQNGEDYLLPVDAHPNALADTAIPMRALFRMLQQAPTRNVMLFLDINRSQGSLQHPVGRQTSALAQECGIPVMFACQLDQFSREAAGLNHGFFTAALLQALRNPQVTTLQGLNDQVQYLMEELCETYWRPIQTPLTISPLMESAPSPTPLGNGTSPALPEPTPSFTPNFAPAQRNSPAFPAGLDRSALDLGLPNPHQQNPNFQDLGIQRIPAAPTPIRSLSELIDPNLSLGLYGASDHQWMPEAPGALYNQPGGWGMDVAAPAIALADPHASAQGSNGTLNDTLNNSSNETLTDSYLAYTDSYADSQAGQDPYADPRYLDDNLDDSLNDSLDDNLAPSPFSLDPEPTAAFTLDDVGQDPYATWMLQEEGDESRPLSMPPALAQPTDSLTAPSLNPSLSGEAMPQVAALSAEAGISPTGTTATPPTNPAGYPLDYDSVETLPPFSLDEPASSEDLQAVGLEIPASAPLFDPLPPEEDTFDLSAAQFALDEDPDLTDEGSNQANTGAGTGTGTGTGTGKGKGTLPAVKLRSRTKAKASNSQTGDSKASNSQTSNDKTNNSETSPRRSGFWLKLLGAGGILAAATTLLLGQFKTQETFPEIVEGLSSDMPDLAQQAQQATQDFLAPLARQLRGAPEATQPEFSPSPTATPAPAHPVAVNPATVVTEAAPTAEAAQPSKPASGQPASGKPAEAIAPPTLQSPIPLTPTGAAPTPTPTPTPTPKASTNPKASPAASASPKASPAAPAQPKAQPSAQSSAQPSAQSSAQPKAKPPAPPKPITHPALTAAQALIQPERASSFSDAIAKARQIEPGQPAYNSARQKMNHWSRSLLDLAATRSKQGDFQGAIAAAKLIPKDLEGYTNAQDRLQEWRVPAQFQQAKAAVQPNQPHSYRQALDLARQIPETHPIHGQVRAEMGKWSDGLLKAAQRQAAAGDFRGAIDLAQQIPPDMPSSKIARNAITQWQHLSGQN